MANEDGFSHASGGLGLPLRCFIICQLACVKKIESAMERYANEIKRVYGVIDLHLKKQGSKYLVGDKITYADLTFFPWQSLLPIILMPGWDYAAEFPTFAAWHRRMEERPAVKRTVESKDFNYLVRH